MRFLIYYKSYPDGRAPEKPDPDDYQEAGAIEADSRSMALVELATATDDLPEVTVYPRPLQTGDILIDEQGKACILTPSSLWAQVQFVPDVY